jgi:WD40 repeat protein/ABC-type dipeptide/oligopeptide/nickel transport system ATPase subunit
MKPIFISYRRDDGIDTAQLLQMHLINMFGDHSVFIDTNTMKPGEEFPIELSNAVTNSKIIIAMIGTKWKGSDPFINRLKQENDWVRKELEIALADEKKKIFPVLIKGATAKNSFADLPQSIERLATFNLVELREKEFKVDLLQLIPLIESYLDFEDPLKDLPLDDEKYLYPFESPYKGLDYFTEEDAKIFFGRGVEIRKLYNKIKNRDILFLFGQSGSGKSSLLFAGLKPRMEYKGWTISYIRRETEIDLSKKLDDYVLDLVDNGKQLIILDQVEEIFTNPSNSISSEEEAQQLVFRVKNLSKKLHVLLSFRKEYLAELKKIFTGLPIEEIYLEPLQTRGVLEAIRGITTSDEARDNYELQFSGDEVPIAIAQSVLSDEESHVAPLLQVILKKMWDKIKNERERIFSKEVLEEVKSNSLVTFLNDQIIAIAKKFEKEVSIGLVLDVLYFFTTARGTSASHSKEEITNKYDNGNVLQVVSELKNKYLLSELRKNNADPDIVRLSHDSLAPLIKELYSTSNLPGQRCSRLLESKSGDLELNYEVEFSKADLAIILAGKDGMRKWTNKENEAIKHSIQLIEQFDLSLEEKNKQLEIALKQAKEQTLQAKAKTMAAEARELARTDPTLALRLAEAACKSTNKATKEAQSAIVDILARKVTFYKKIYRGHKDKITSVAFSPDGRLIVAGSDDNYTRIWDWEGTQKVRFNGRSAVSSVAFAPDGRSILIGSENRTVILLNLDETFTQQSLEGHTDDVSSVVFSPDGKYILTICQDFTARLWSADGILKKCFKVNILLISSVAFSPDGQWVFTGGKDRTALLWNLDGILKRTFKGHSKSVISVAFSPDGTSILTGSYDHTARLWDLDGTCKQIFKGHTKPIHRVAFSPDGKYILTKAGDKVGLWNLDGSLKQFFEGYPASSSSVDFSASGEYILIRSGGTTLAVWHIEGVQKQFIEGHSINFSSIAFSHNGKWIICGSDDNTVKAFSLAGTPNLIFKGHADQVSSASFSPDGKWILTGSRDNTARIWHLDGTLNKSFEHTASVGSAVFSPDGKCILIGNCLRSIDGTLKKSFKGYGFELHSVSFSPDGASLLTPGKDWTARLWNLDGTLKQSFEGHTASVYAVAFSPDGKHVLTGSMDNTARLWNLDGTLQRSFEGHKWHVSAVAFSPDGKYVLTAGSLDDTAKLWSIDGALVQSFEGHKSDVNAVAFSPDGKYVLTGSLDKTARLWNFDGILMQFFEGHTESVSSVAFSPDGKHVLTGSYDKTARLWRPFWEILNPENTYLPNSQEIKDYDVPEDIEWGKIW